MVNQDAKLEDNKMQSDSNNNVTMETNTTAVTTPATVQDTTETIKEIMSEEVSDSKGNDNEQNAEQKQTTYTIPGKVFLLCPDVNYYSSYKRFTHEQVSIYSRSQL